MRTIDRASTLIAVFLLTFASVGSLAGAAGVQAQMRSASRAADAWPYIRLSVVVLDKSRDPNATLPASEFRVFEDGSERKVESVSRQDSPMSVAFVIDTSGSMYKQGARVATVVRTVVHALPPGSEIAAIEFADTPHVEQALAPVAGNTLAVLQHLDARGCTALLDGVLKAEALLAGQAHHARRALVIVGDGGDNCSTQSLDEAVRAFQSPEAPSIYAFLLVPVVKLQPGPTEQGGRVMRALVRFGGAVVFAPRRDQEVAESATKMAAIIRSQYLLDFTAADAARDGRRHVLDVRVPIRNLLIFAIPSCFAPAD